MFMYVEVDLIGYPLFSLTYTCNEKDLNLVVPGVFVQVPLKKKHVWGIVKKVIFAKPFNISSDVLIKNIIKIYVPEESYFRFLQHIAFYHIIEEKAIYAFLTSFLSRAGKIESTAHKENKNNEHQDLVLTDEQWRSFNAIVSCFEKNKPIVFHGVTGSGKTAVYAALIKYIYDKGQSVIVLAPDITLVQALHQKIVSLLPSYFSVLAVHSALSSKEKDTYLQSVYENKQAVYVGVHIPIMLPIAMIGLCIVDEEHESGYQTKRYPFMNMKDVAVYRSYTQKYPLVLGSATPSIISLYRARLNIYEYVVLNVRYFAPSLVTTYHCSMKSFEWIPSSIRDSISECINRGEQVLLHVNRRGSHSSALCSVCNTFFMCKNCSVPYTVYHSHILRCHHCGDMSSIGNKCFQCGSSAHVIEKRGLGIQQVATIMKKFFPEKNIELVEFDSLSEKKRWPSVLKKICDGDIDIIIGTGSLARGYHFPRLTLAVAVWADMHASLPGYCNLEHLVQSLIQLTGRLAREGQQGTMIIQTTSFALLKDFLSEDAYSGAFYEYECEHRKKMHYPPFCALGIIVIKNRQEGNLVNLANAFLKELRVQCSSEKILFIGPVPAPLYKINNIYSMHILVKADKYVILSQELFACKNLFKKYAAFYVPNPLSFSHF